MVPVYGTAKVIDCKACHVSVIPTDPNHAVCEPIGVKFDSDLPMIGAIDSYTPGATLGTGVCNIYCHSDGNEPPLNTSGAYNYIGTQPSWSQSTVAISYGNNQIGSKAVSYECHYIPPPPPGHPGPGVGGGGVGPGPTDPNNVNCSACHPVPTDPDDLLNHINGELEITPGGPGGGLGMPVP